MDKLIQSQSTQETVKICYGNDFTLTVSVNEWNADASAWDKLDLSAASDIELFLVAQNGKRIKTTSSLDNEGNITADIPATYLSKTVYALEITFKQDNRNRRTYSPCLIQIVNSTDEAGKSVIDYTTNDAYHFDILVKNDIAWLNIGTLPSEYITQEELDEVLTSYVTNAALDSMSYVTQSSLDSMSYVTNAALETMAYVTADELDAMSYVTNDSLDAMSYVTNAALETMAYVDSSTLDTTLESYVTGDALESKLTAYVTGGSYDSDLHMINLYHDNVVVSSIDASAFIIDGMIENVYISNGYLVIEFNTDAGKQDIEIPLTSIFDPSNYYDKSDIDTTLSAYVTNAALETMAYVTHDYLDQQSYITINDIPAIAGEVTYAFLDAQSYVQCYTSSYIYELTQSEFNTLQQNDELEESYLYYITDAALAGGEVTYAWLDQCAYVTHDYLDQQSYIDSSAIPQDLSSFNNDMGFVDSQTVTTIWTGSQADYNLLTPDANTLYIIV